MGRRAKVYIQPLDFKVHTNWSNPCTNFFAGLLKLRGALASRKDYVLIREWNEKCEFPIRVNPKLPWNDQVSKVYKHKLWVVASYGKDHDLAKVENKVPFIIKVINVLAYPLRFIPEYSKFCMPEYTQYTWRLGDYSTGYSIQFQIPKKFKMRS